MAGIIEVKDQGKVRIYDADNSNYVDIVVPSTVSSNRTITLPDASFTVPQADTNTVYTHPNHSGEVTSTADGATVIADNIVDEANLKVSNSPTNGYFLSAQSGNTGGLTWAEAGGGGKILQSLFSTVAEASGTTTISWGAAAPSSGEGTQIFTKNITPAATTSKVRITGVINCGALSQDTSNGFGVAIFRNTYCCGAYAMQDWTAFTDGSYVFPIHIIDEPYDDTAVTYSVRVGNLYDSSHNTTTWKVGGSATGRGAKFNQRLSLNTIEINEIGA